MIKKILLFLLLLFYLPNYAQSDCFQNAEGDYWPFHEQERKFHVSGSEFVISYSKDSLALNGKFYFQRTKQHKNGKIEHDYFRKSRGVVYQYNQTAKKETIVMPSNLKKGETWETLEGHFKYKIKSLKANLETPYCDFDQLLEIEVVDLNNKIKSQYFYKKGIGLVGKNVDQHPYSFIAPDEKVKQKEYTAIGCENIKDEVDQKKCTNSKIVEFLLSNLENPTPEVHGKVIYSISIDEKGKVDQVSVVGNTGASKKQVKSGLKTLKKLPQFIPAHSGEKPVRVILNLPLSF